jgi:2-phospho-L-lactate/phosphoenolpyruvate guanylyltransferase
MARVVVPFRGEGAKQRIVPTPEAVRSALALAMLEDVLAACTAVGETVLVACNTSFERPGVRRVEDPGEGQGPAVEAALRVPGSTPILVVNADLPCVQPRDLLTLLGALPPRGLALIAAADGTTNALALASSHLFAPLYGPGSAKRFLARADRLDVPAVVAEIPNLADDVDTLADLERLEGRLGPRTSGMLEELRAGLPR